MCNIEGPYKPNEEYIEMANSPILARELGSDIMAIVDQQFLIEVTIRERLFKDTKGNEGALYFPIKQMLIERRLMPLFARQSAEPFVIESFNEAFTENTIDMVEVGDVTPILFLLKEFAIYVLGKQHERYKQLLSEEKKR